MNVVEFPRKGLQNIADMARKFADDIDAGEYGEIRATLLVVENEESILGFGWGDAGDPVRNIGLMHTAINLMLGNGQD